MSNKYRVPALERANMILQLLAENSNELRLTDLVKLTGINKSTLYSLLKTLESMSWITKEKGGTYILGTTLGSFSAAYLRQFNIMESFFIESEKSIAIIDEPIQLGVLEKSDVVYLARKDSNTKIRLATEPGSRFPAHATAIGKIQLSEYSDEEILKLYASKGLEKKTDYTITSLDELLKKLEEYRNQGFAIEEQEGALGFCCVAAPIYNHERKLIAGVSFTMLEVDWKSKKELATKEILNLSSKLSKLAGYDN